MVEHYFKVLVFYLVIVLVVHDEQGLRHLLLGFLGVMALYMLHSLYEFHNGRHTFRMGISRMIGVDQAMSDPNSFGATIVYALPFLVPFWVLRPSRQLRCFLAAYLALSVVCIGLTGSRSSFLGLLLWAIVAAMRSRWRWSLFLLLILAAPVLWAALPSSLQNRFETIIHPEVGPANALVSGQGRLEGFFTGLNLWTRYPITGCGPGVWRPATGSTLESHNLYGQLLGEMGTLGALTFAGILLAIWSNLRRIRRICRVRLECRSDFACHVARAVGMSVFLLLFEGNFSHNLFRYSWLWYGGFLIIAHYCLCCRQEEPALAESPPGGAELGLVVQ
jgi:O-antigen ligase